MYRFTLLLSFTFASFCVNAYAQIYTPPKNIQLKLYNNDPNQIHVNIKPDKNNDNSENVLYYNVSYYSLNKGLGTESWFDNAGGRGDTLGVYENTDTRYNEGTRYFQPDNQFQNNQYGSTSSVQAESSWFDKSTNWYNNEPLV